MRFVVDGVVVLRLIVKKLIVRVLQVVFLMVLGLFVVVLEGGAGEFAVNGLGLGIILEAAFFGQLRDGLGLDDGSGVVKVLGVVLAVGKRMLVVVGAGMMVGAEVGAVLFGVFAAGGLLVEVDFSVHFV